MPVEGICLYPVVDYPGWVDERHCATGLLGHPDAEGKRECTLRLPKNWPVSKPVSPAGGERFSQDGRG